jgi:hypothetical protein
MASVPALPRASLLATLSVVAGVVGVLGGAACGTDAVGVDACREIEAARCKRAAECGLPLDYPRPAGDPVAACERFYVDACLHGIQSGVEPTLPQRKACVDAVTTSTCDVVREPQRAAGCAFIIPSAEGATPEPTSTTAPPPPVAQPDSGK